MTYKQKAFLFPIWCVTMDAEQIFYKLSSVYALTSSASLYRQSSRPIGCTVWLNIMLFKKNLNLTSSYLSLFKNALMYFKSKPIGLEQKIELKGCSCM